MKFKVSDEFVEFLKEHPNCKAWDFDLDRFSKIQDNRKYRGPKFVECGFEELSKGFKEDLHTICQNDTYVDLYNLRNVRARINRWVKLNDKKGKVRAKNLSNFQYILSEYFQYLPEHMVFLHSILEGTNIQVRNFWRFESATYTPVRREKDGKYTRVYPDYITVRFARLKHTKSNSESNPSKEYESFNIDPRQMDYTPRAFMEAYDITPCAKKDIKILEAQNEHYFQTCDMTGEQFYATGRGSSGQSTSRWWYNSSSYNLNYEGKPTRCLVTMEEEGDCMIQRPDVMTYSPLIPYQLEEVRFEGEGFEDDDYNIERVKVHTKVLYPIEAKVKIFCMNRHQFYWCHMDQLKEYVYKPELKDSLILPDFTQDMINLLITQVNKGEELLVQDIVEDKRDGVLIMATGVPGVGKTLTAEVYSQIVKRPLYVVRAADLGTSIDSIESNLRKVLQQSYKWRCILLLDECDVYFRQRGDDLVQNGIVGVFLRVLERYPGILFMTSNRQDMIDDAIMSRCTVSLKYRKPTIREAIQIGHVQAETFGRKLNEADFRQWLLELSVQNGDYVTADDVDYEGEDAYISKASGRNIRKVMMLINWEMDRRGLDQDSPITYELWKFGERGREIR